MLIVAADDGVMPQTIEHLNIVNLLNVSHGVAVITKCDRVAPERVAEVVAGVKALLADTKLAAIPVMPASAISGEGIETLRGELSTAAKAHQQREHAGRHLRYTVDRVFTKAGSGTVVTGTVVTGAVAVGDHLMLSPGGIEVRVRGMQKQSSGAQQAAAGERCAINLSGVELAQVSRGDWLVAPAVHAPTKRIDARLQVLASEAQPLKHWTPVHLHLGTTDVTGRIAIRRGAVIAPGRKKTPHSIARCQALIQTRADTRFTVPFTTTSVLRNHLFKGFLLKLRELKIVEHYRYELFEGNISLDGVNARLVSAFPLPLTFIISRIDNITRLLLAVALGCTR
jgi:selenocysteine-specific translation elongation factor